MLDRQVHRLLLEDLPLSSTYANSLLFQPENLTVELAFLLFRLRALELAPLACRYIHRGTSDNVPPTLVYHGDNLDLPRGYVR